MKEQFQAPHLRLCLLKTSKLMTFCHNIDNLALSTLESAFTVNKAIQADISNQVSLRHSVASVARANLTGA